MDNNNQDKRIEQALDVAWSYAQIDGDYHKMWVIDQMVRILCGSEESYAKWVEKYEQPDEGDDEDDGYTWDCGIAP